MPRKVKLSYVPHGINPKWYHPITEEHPEEWKEFSEFQDNFKTKNGVDFIVFWQNRNIRRKQPGDVILAFRRFCDQLPPDQAKRVCLLMKTQVADQNGTDLIAVKKNICPKYKVIFNEEILHPKIMNFMYNMADVTVNIASNEGFGLSNAESIMAGTVTVTNVTGGLQDQCRFEISTGEWLEFTPDFPSNHAGTFRNCGPWTIPVFPSNRSLQGSIPTPYIFDDRCKFEDVADALLQWYNTPKEQRDHYGRLGHEWLKTKESGMSSQEMCSRFTISVDDLLASWQPPENFEMMKFEPKTYPDNIGIIF